MPVKITYFVHGTTTDNEQGLATGWAPGELSETGIEQAEKLGLLVQDKIFDSVFCSDLKRAVDTSHSAFEEKYTIIEDARLREANYGDFTQQPSKDFKADMTKWIDTKYPGGESYRDVENRIADFVNFLKESYEGKHIAIVAHQAPQLAFDVVLKGKTWEQAIAEDWRHTKSWQPGWEYEISD
ncbi:histidine phosphatase family protein [Patescibacteria group bacterium]|nr:histidine phosphatase family protein [Patescibacteria group bacterium]